MPGIILIPQINSTLKDDQFLALFNDIDALSHEVLWNFEKDTLQSHLKKFDNNPRPDDPRYQILHDLTRFFTYALAHIPQYPSGGYYELLVDWIYATPELFGHAQEMRFQYAVQTWYSVFTSYGEYFAEDHNTLLILATNFITQPARFTALICYMLANNVNITILMESQVLQDFFAYYANELLQDENPIAYFYHTLLAISKKQAEHIPSINQALIDAVENLFFDVGNTFDAENAGIESIVPQLIALTQRFPHVATKSTSPVVKRASHLEMSSVHIMDYYYCFGLDWIAPALDSELSCDIVGVFLIKALSLSASLSFFRPKDLDATKALQAYNGILSHLIQQALTMDLDQSATLMGRLALKLNPLRRNVQLKEYPELLFLLILNPYFCFLSDKFLAQTDTVTNHQFWPERISDALGKVLPADGRFTTTYLYLLTKLLMMIETAKNPDGTLLFAAQFTQWLNIYLVHYISTRTGFEIDINRVNSKSFYPGAQAIAANNANSILIALRRYIQNLDYNVAQVYKQWLSHPEKLMLFSFLLTGHHHFQHFSPKNIVSALLLLAKWERQTNTPNVKNWLIENVHDFAANDPDQLETLMLALLHTFNAIQQEVIIQYLSQKYSGQLLLDLFLNVDSNFLYQIIDMKNVVLLKKIVLLPMRVELQTKFFLYALNNIDPKKGASSIAKQENIHCLRVFLEHILLSEEAKFALLFFIIQYDRSDLVTLCRGEQYKLDPFVLSSVFSKMAELRKFECLSHFPKYFELSRLDCTIISTVFNDIAAQETLEIVQHYFNTFGVLLPFQAIGDAFLTAVHSNNWGVYAFLYEELQNLEPSCPPENNALHYLKKALMNAYPQVHALKKLLILKGSDEQLNTILIGHLKQSIHDGIVNVFVHLKEYLSDQCSNAELDEWAALAKNCPHENIRAAAHNPSSPRESSSRRSISDDQLASNISTPSLPTPNPCLDSCISNPLSTSSSSFWNALEGMELMESPPDPNSDGFTLSS